LSGAGSAGRNSTAESQHGRRPSTPWAQRQEELLRDCIVFPDVFNPMVDRLRAFVVPYQQALETEAGQRNLDLREGSCDRTQQECLGSEGYFPVGV